MVQGTDRPENVDQPAFGVGDSVELHVQLALCAPDEAPPLRPWPLSFACRLDAVRCAFRVSASIMTVRGLSASAAKLSIMRAKTPIPLQRFHRL